MTKSFCDICEKPAAKHRSIRAEHQFGPLHSMLNNANKRVRTKVVVCLSFAFSDHETGYGGPPDLCDECILDLIGDLKKEAEKAQ